MSEAPKQSTVNSRISTKAVAVLIILAALLVVVVLLVRVLGGPVHGSTVKILPSTIKKTAPVAPAVQVDGKYFTLETPVGYTVQENIPAVAGILASAMLLHPSTSGTQLISIAVTAAEDGLAANTSYAARRADATRYTFTSMAVSGESVSIARDTQTSGAVSFWRHGSYIATISVRSGFEAAGSGANTEELKTIKMLLANWRWAQ